MGQARSDRQELSAVLEELSAKTAEDENKKWPQHSSAQSPCGAYLDTVALGDGIGQTVEHCTKLSVSLYYGLSTFICFVCRK